MRSPVIAFSIIAAAVGPQLVSGAPTSSHLDKALVEATKGSSFAARNFDLSGVVSGVSGSQEQEGKHAEVKQDDPVSRTEAIRKQKEQSAQGGTSNKMTSPPSLSKSKRAGDAGTAGGNAYSGAASSSDGGDVYNQSTQGGTTNADGSNAAGGAGSSFSGIATGGAGNGHGPGGNAYTGATGNSRGGNAINNSEGTGGDIDNTTANTAGGGGFSESGTAQGGDAGGFDADEVNPETLQRRAGDSGTAGGSAYSGATSDVSGGSAVNTADDQSTVTNDGGNTAGGAGTTYSGDAYAGDGDGFGPGGNAYTGASGPADGGFVYNSGGTLDNEADSNAAGGGGVSQTGDAVGGDA